MNKVNRIIKVISSCTTVEQLDSCKTWVKSIKTVKEGTGFTDIHDNFITKLQLESLILKTQSKLLDEKLKCLK